MFVPGGVVGAMAGSLAATLFLFRVAAGAAPVRLQAVGGTQSD
jgi:hypothetical protein